MKAGDKILLDGVSEVTIKQIVGKIAVVSYSDLTRRTLDLSKYDVKYAAQQL